jgi:hypothetical protein
MMKKYLIPLIFTTVCLCITIGYVAHLHRNYEAQKEAWNQVAAETFREALLKEVEWRSKIPYYKSIVGASGVGPLKPQIPDSVVVVTEEFGWRVYRLQKERFKRQLLEGGELNSGISYLIGEYPISVDTLKHRWDSLLNRKLRATTAVRYVLTDLGEHRDTTFANRDYFAHSIDSSLVSYIGYRCEAEFVGCVHYPSLWRACSPLNWALLLLPFLLLALILIYYPQISAAIRRRFIKKEIVHVADASIERAKVYQLPDGMLFDVMAHSIRKGNEAFHLSPQSVNLLKLLLRSPERKVTIEGINQELWNGKASKGKIEVAISRFRSDIKKASPNLTLDYSNGTFQLKMPHSIEE